MSWTLGLGPRQAFVCMASAQYGKAGLGLSSDTLQLLPGAGS